MPRSGVGWLQWQWAVVIACAGLLVGLVWRGSERPWQRAVAAFGRELALVLSLYTLWILAGRLSVVRVDEGLANGRWVYRAQDAIGLPSETVLQNWIIAHPWIARFSNGYYAIVHAPAMMIALLWLFLSHRDCYARWRTALALTTFACLLIQFIPVAPPRMFPQYGFVDVARLFDQSVYGPIGQGIADQLSAMPSVHVAWAVWVGAVVVFASSSRWRWLVLAHPLATIFAVSATANHWWLDGIVASALLVLAVLFERSFSRAKARVGQTLLATPALSASAVAPAANEPVELSRPISTSSGSRRSSTYPSA